MSRPDEGLIHAWLDGELDAAEIARVEALVRDDPEWAAAAAQARGFIVASSRILGALDDVPANVVPAKAGAAPEARATPPQTVGTGGALPHTAGTPAGRRGTPWWMMRAAAVLVVVAGTVIVVRRTPQEPDAAFATAQTASKDLGGENPAATPASSPTAAPAPLPSPPRSAAASDLAGGRNAPAAADAKLSETDAGQRMEKVAVQAKTVAPPMPTAPSTDAAAAAGAGAPIPRALGDEQRAADVVGRATVTGVTPPPAAKASNEVMALQATPVAPTASAASATSEMAARRQTTGGAMATGARTEGPAVACYRETSAPGVSAIDRRAPATVYRVVPTSDSTAVPVLPADGRRAAERLRADAPPAQLIVRHDTLFLGAADGRARVALRITCPQP